MESSSRIFAHGNFASSALVSAMSSCMSLLSLITGLNFAFLAARVDVGILCCGVLVDEEETGTPIINEKSFLFYKAFLLWIVRLAPAICLPTAILPLLPLAPRSSFRSAGQHSGLGCCPGRLKR